MPRASWRGFLRFSLVSCSIYLSPATTRAKSIRLHQVWQVIGSARKRPFAPDSPLCGNRRLSQFVEQRLGLFEIGGVEAFGEPGVNRGEQGDRVLRPAPSRRCTTRGDEARAMGRRRMSFAPRL